MVFVFLLVLLGLFSSSSHAMEQAAVPQMILVAHGGDVAVPVDVAMKSETLQAHNIAASRTTEDPLVYIFQRKLPEGLTALEQAAFEQADLSYSSAEQNVLRDLFKGISDSAYFCVMTDFEHLQNLFVMADYLRVPQYTRGLLLCRLLNAMKSDQVDSMNPHVANIIRYQLAYATRDGFLDLRKARFSNLDGFLVFLEKANNKKCDEGLKGRNVRAIDLSQNMLQKVDFPRLLRCFPQLHSLDLSHNDLETIAAQNIPYDFYLDISHNLLQGIAFNVQQQRLHLACVSNNLVGGQTALLLHRTIRQAPNRFSVQLVNQVVLRMLASPTSKRIKEFLFISKLTLSCFVPAMMCAGKVNDYLQRNDFACGYYIYPLWILSCYMTYCPLSLGLVYCQNRTFIGQFEAFVAQRVGAFYRRYIAPLRNCLQGFVDDQKNTLDVGEQGLGRSCCSRL